jgi:MazG family protein
LREYVLEESHELLAAIDEDDPEKIRLELGDLLLQIVFLSQIYEEQQRFSIREVIGGLQEKLIRRHPHIFGNARVENSRQVKDNWEKIKLAEKSKKSIISSYPETMPALLTAQRIASQASSVGFDWNDSLAALEKVEEEVGELKNEIRNGDQEKCREEIGDLLFALTNVARLLKINAEFALRGANDKFRKRFSFIESELQKAGRNVSETPLEELEALWQRSKKEQ